MQYVYILQSLKYPHKHYIGCTNDVAERSDNTMQVSPNRNRVIPQCMVRGN